MPGADVNTRCSLFLGDDASWEFGRRKTRHLPCGFLPHTMQELFEESPWQTWRKFKRQHVLLPCVPQDQSSSNILRQGIQQLPVLSHLSSCSLAPSLCLLSVSSKSLHQSFTLHSQTLRKCPEHNCLVLKQPSTCIHRSSQRPRSPQTSRILGGLPP